MYNISRVVRENTVRKKRKEHWTEILKNQAKEFCLSTGLHGYKYAAQAHRTKIERILWGIVVATALCCAGALMRIAWNYNSTRSTMTVIESTHHGIWNYPFPAVTICNVNRVSLRSAEQFVRQLKLQGNMKEEYLLAEMGLLNELLSPGLYDYDVTDNLTRLQDIFDENGYSIREVVQQVTQNCSNLILACKWKSKWTECSKFFVESLSREGLCCSFNYITTEDPRIPAKQVPKRVNACGYQTGLTVLLNPDPNDYLAALLGSYGVKVMLHHPYDYPDYNAENKLVGMGNQVFLSISPEETYSTEEVRRLSINTRDCVFNDERTLSRDYDINQLDLIYALYTYKNCISACRSKTIREKCQCIPYYFPQQGTRVCDLKDVKCLKDHSSWFEDSWPGVSMTSESIPSIKIDETKRPCGCMPDCTAYRFPVESSVGTLDYTIAHGNMAHLQNIIHENASMVHIFFSDLVSIQYRQHSQYNWRNMFASFGGLLGLFAGFSLMSGYELIYFFVIRVIADACKKKKEDESYNRENVRFNGKIIKTRGFRIT